MLLRHGYLHLDVPRSATPHDLVFGNLQIDTIRLDAGGEIPNLEGRLVKSNGKFTEDLKCYLPGNTLPRPTNTVGLLIDLGALNLIRSEQQASVTEWLSKNEPSPRLRDDLIYRQFDLS